MRRKQTALPENRREAIFQKINPLIIGIFSLAVIVIGVRFILEQNPYSYTLTFLSLLFLPLPYLFYRIFRIKPLYQLNVLIYVFVFAAYTFGVAMRGYNNIAWMDKVTHGISGVIFTFVGFLLFYILKPEKKRNRKDCAQVCFFSVSFSMTIAVIWEIIEYIINFILHNDPQRVAATGVNDTMQDMIACGIGSLVMMLSILLYYRKNRKLLLTGIVDTFVRRYDNA